MMEMLNYLLSRGSFSVLLLAQQLGYWVQCSLRPWARTTVFELLVQSKTTADPAKLTGAMATYLEQAFGTLDEKLVDPDVLQRWKQEVVTELNSRPRIGTDNGNMVEVLSNTFDFGLRKRVIAAVPTITRSAIVAFAKKQITRPWLTVEVGPQRRQEKGCDDWVDITYETVRQATTARFFVAPSAPFYDDVIAPKQA